jgi:hypothetical protein
MIRPGELDTPNAGFKKIIQMMMGDRDLMKKNENFPEWSLEDLL